MAFMMKCTFFKVFVKMHFFNYNVNKLCVLFFVPINLINNDNNKTTNLPTFEHLKIYDFECSKDVKYVGMFEK